MKIRRRFFRWKRRLHISIGLFFALYFLLLAFTGVMINHAGDWDLGERYVSRRYLPSSYRPQDGDATRLDIVITDLHSGRLFGPHGHWIPDLVTGFWVISILTGVGMLVFRRLWLAPKLAPKETPTTAELKRAPHAENKSPEVVAAELERKQPAALTVAAGSVK
ncbi:MAG TPA: hypothetical protein VM182_03985 [Terriglobia bacterium]|nr:hypothetical protein [Terriglobia bacterium]